MSIERWHTAVFGRTLGVSLAAQCAVVFFLCLLAAPFVDPFFYPCLVLYFPVAATVAAFLPRDLEAFLVFADPLTGMLVISCGMLVYSGAFALLARYAGSELLDRSDRKGSR